MADRVTHGVKVRADAIGEEHVGWNVSVAGPNGDRTDLTLGGVRKWTDEGASRVALLDTSTAGGPWKGTEFTFDGDLLVTLLRPFTAKARRRARADNAPPRFVVTGEQ